MPGRAEWPEEARVLRLPKRPATRLAPLLSLLFLVGCIDLPTFLPEPDVTLRVAVPDASQAAYLAERIQSFERANPTIQVKVFSQMSVFRGNLASGISTLVNSNDGLDVVYLTDQDFHALSDPDIFADLTPYIRETSDLQPGEFYPTALPVFQNRGRQMVLPAEMVPLVIYYNRDLFDRASAAYPTADWTMTDFLLAAKRLTATEQKGAPATVGFVADPMLTVWPFVLAYGGEFPDPASDTSVRALTAPATVRGFQWFVDLSLREKVMPYQPGWRSLGLWFGGRAGMVALFMNTRNVVPAEPGRPGATPTPGPRQTWPFRWDVAMIPREARRATIVYVAGYGIPKGAKNPNEAWQLIRYLTRTLPAQGTGSSYVPALKSLASSAEFASLYPEAGKRAYLESIEFGYTIPVLPAAAQPGEQDLAPIFRGEVTASQGLQRLREKMMPAFEKWAQQQNQ